MKRIVLLLFVLSAYKMYAQNFELGVKGGVNYAQSVILQVVSTNGINVNEVQNEKGMGLVFGGFARASFGKIIFQPEILFSEDQQLVTLADADVQNMDLGDFLTLNVDKMDIPLIIGYRAFNTIRLMGGPVFSHVQVDANDPLFQFDNLTMGYQAGIGFDIGKISADARYEGNLSKFKDQFDTENGAIEVDSRKSLFQFTLGYSLFGK